MYHKLSGFIVFGVLLGALMGAVEGCDSVPFVFPCDPMERPCPDPYTCIEEVCYLPDAGTDAAIDGPTSAIGCSGPCLPYPPGEWNLRALWHGPAAEAPQICPALGTDGETALPLFVGRADVSAPPANCDRCKCTEATGACTTLPETIEVRAATCGAAGTSTPFGGPDGWDGSCTNVNALPAGAMCGGVLCAQSIAVSPLGAPGDETCAPFAEPIPVTQYGLPAPRWATAAIGCRIPTCNVPSASCLPSIRRLPDGFLTCIKREGEHVCPAAWNGDRFVVYEVTHEKPGWLEGRECTACECGEPVGGACLARVRTFEDGACSKLISDDGISSVVEQCSNAPFAGLAIGSKEITPPAYLPGACEPSGGEPSGDVKEDPAQAVTFCCRPPDT